MSASLNRAMIIGNLGADPEVRSTNSGTPVATLSVATNRSWTDADGNEKTATEWHRVVCWERLAEVADEYLSKGDRVYAEGRIEHREWEGDDGRTRHTTEIRARRLIMLGSSSGSSAGGGERSRRREASPETGDVTTKPSKDDKRVGGVAERGGGEARQDDLPF